MSHVRSEGRIERRRAGPGGLVAVVEPALRSRGGTWIFAPSNAVDRELARSGSGGISDGDLTLLIVDLPERAHRDHYRVVSTQLLTPLFHYLLPLAAAPTLDARLQRSWDGYLAVNDLYAQALCDCDPGTPALVEDVFLLPLAAAARATAAAERRMAYFHHIPWCEPDYFGVLGDRLRRDVLNAMLAYDSVGFHCRRWADAFVACCDRFVPDAALHDDAIEWRGRRTQIVVSPAPIDAGQVADVATAERTMEWRRRLLARCGDRTVIGRVERADPQKNAVRGLKAFELLLTRRPELADSTCLLAVMTPVREWIPAYRAYLREIKAVAGRVNRRFGYAGGDGPVLLHLAPDEDAHDHYRAVAALTLATALVVNSVFDGLNLVALEGVVSGEPALVLSENAGVHAQLGDHALTVSPFDVAGTSEALEKAVCEPAEERRARAAQMREIAVARSPSDWMRDRLEAIGCE